MKITQEQLDKIVESHGKWLRNEEGGERADLRNADLRNAVLRNAVLSYADLSGADLRNAVLSGADLRNAVLRNADLSYAVLRNADLSGADLRNAVLRNAVLSYADLSGADLRNAVLRNADLSYAVLRNADLSYAVLRNAVLDKIYYQVTRIGSRNGTTTYCVEDDNVLCGCWNNYKGGTLAEFEARVESVYGEQSEMPNGKYYIQYMEAIKFFKAMKTLNENKAE